MPTPPGKKYIFKVDVKVGEKSRELYSGGDVRVARTSYSAMVDILQMTEAVWRVVASRQTRIGTEKSILSEGTTQGGTFQEVVHCIPENWEHVTLATVRDHRAKAMWR